jgi:putative ABC transport system permease protein
MLSLLRLLSLRHFFGSPLRTFITVAGVAIGVATLVGITSINKSVMNAFRSTIDTVAGKADLTVAAEASGMNESVLETVRQVKGVAHASGGVTVVAPVKDAPGQSLYLMGVDLLDDGFFRTYEGVDTDVGKLADDLEFLNSTDRVLLSERYAREHALKTGSTFELLTPDGAKTFVVHGLLKETGPLKAFGGAVGVMFFGSLQEAFSRGRTLTRIDVAAADKKDVEALKARLRTAVGPTIEVDEPEHRGQSVETMMRSFQLGLNLGSGVALLVGIFLVYNTVSIGVVQRRREIGTLRALGATRSSIRWLFALESMVLGIIGSALGIPAGVGVGRLAIGGIADSISALYVRVNINDVRLGTTEVLLGLALGIFGSLFAAMRPAWVASSVQPVEALRRDVALGGGAVVLGSWPTFAGVALLVLAWPVTYLPAPVENMALGGYLSVFMILMGVTLLSPLLLRWLNRPFQAPAEFFFGIAGRIAADNFARAPLRTAVPVSALTIGVAMAVTLGGFVGSFQASSQRWIDQAIPADLFVTSSAKVAGVQNQPMNGSVIDEITDLPGVDVVDPVRILPYDALGLRIYVISNDANIYQTRGTPLILSGSLPDEARRNAGEVIISENLSRRRNLKVGDTFEINTPTGPRTFKTAAVIIDYTSDQGAVIIDRKIFNVAFNDTRVDTFHIYLKNRAHDTEPVRSAITARLGKKFDLYVLSNAELREEASNIIGNAFSVTYAMEVVAVILALLGVINTLLAAVLDRTREIGLLRAVGADRMHIIKLFAAEAALIGFTGGVLGVVVGGVVGAVVTSVVGVQATGWDFPFIFPLKTSIQMFFAATVCAILAGLYPARRASRLDVVEALAWE